MTHLPVRVHIVVSGERLNFLVVDLNLFLRLLLSILNLFLRRNRFLFLGARHVFLESRSLLPLIRPIVLRALMARPLCLEQKAGICNGVINKKFVN